MRVSRSLDDTPYFGGTGMSDHRLRFGSFSPPIIIVVIVVEIKELHFRIISGDDCVCPLLQGFLIPIINTTFIELSTTAYLFLFLSSSYPMTELPVPL